jgi:DNA-binding MarR family transcriptional regulator
MKTRHDAVAQDLLEAFSQFRRLHWRESPIAGLTPGELRVLMFVRRAAGGEPFGHGLGDAEGEGTGAREGAKVSEISSMLRVASPTATQQINELEARGYVERATDPDDRRAVRVTLTPKGEATIRQAHEAFVASFKGLVDHLGEEQSRQLADLLTRTFTYFNDIRDSNS